MLALPHPDTYCSKLLNPILGGGGHKVPKLISTIRIFAMNTATANLVTFHKIYRGIQCCVD